MRSRTLVRYALLENVKDMLCSDTDAHLARYVLRRFLSLGYQVPPRTRAVLPCGRAARVIFVVRNY